MDPYSSPYLNAIGTVRLMLFSIHSFIPSKSIQKFAATGFGCTWRLRWWLGFRVWGLRFGTYLVAC